MIKVYIASPYSNGDKNINVLRQICAYGEIISMGAIPYAPLLAHYVDEVCPQSYDTWMKIDFEWIAECDCLLRLEGDSSGADAEVKEMLRLGRPVFYSLDELKLYLKQQNEEK